MMASSTLPVSMPEPLTEPLPVADIYCRIFRQRVDSLSLIKQLNQLVIAAQQHRGLSMTLLGGDLHFQKEFEKLQTTLSRRILILQTFNHEAGRLIPENDLKKMESAWNTLRSGWQEDSVLDNFELHCHLIDQLLGLIHQLCKNLDRPLINTPCLDPLISNRNHDDHSKVKGSNGIGSRQWVMQLGLLVFTSRQLPDMVELIAKIRGLSTHAMVTGNCDSTTHQKLQFLLRTAKAQRERLNLSMGRMNSDIRDRIPSLLMIKTYDLKLMYMLDTVEQQLFSGDPVSINQVDFFELGSSIITVYMEVVYESLALLQEWQEQQLAAWIEGEG